MWDFIVSKYNYWIYIVIMMLGFYGMMVKNNLIKKLIGMNIFQTSIILYFISTASKRNATLPIVEYHHGYGPGIVHAVDFINPLPHVLMLTAIVVGVSTLGVALAIVILIYKRYHTLEEDEILESKGK